MATKVVRFFFTHWLAQTNVQARAFYSVWWLSMVGVYKSKTVAMDTSVPYNIHNIAIIAITMM